MKSMGNIFLTIFLTMTSFVAGQEAYSKTISYGTETEPISIASGKDTIFRFDEEVKTISQVKDLFIGPADAQDPNYRTLVVRPKLTNGTSVVTFILADESVMHAKIIVVAADMPEKTDTFYDFKPKETSIDPKTDGAKGAAVSEIDLMKGMIRSENVLGYGVRSLVRTVNSGIPEVTTKLVKVYTGPKYNGYVFQITNQSRTKAFSIDLKSLTLGSPNVALLSQVDGKQLNPNPGPGHETYLRIVAKASSVYYSVTLPVDVMEK